ncbi:MAG: SDR family oxidoreductase [Polyangiales bacterium]
MENVFVTGATGYIGGYVCQALLADPKLRLSVLVRSPDDQSAWQRLWRSWQLHVSAEVFRRQQSRVTLVPGDLSAPGLGLAPATRQAVLQSTDSIVHIAAALNRRSERACLNTNLRGTLAMIQLARQLHARRGLRRFSAVSTVGIAGQRAHECLTEEQALDWQRRDYDPYGRTKKFAEHMVHELLADLPVTIFRPSIVLGDSRLPQTTQFDMVRALCALADLPLLPLPPDTRLDIVNADFVGHAIATLHRREPCAHRCYHLSTGRDAPTARAIAACIRTHQGRRPPRFAPQLSTAFQRAVHTAAQLPGRSALQRGATLIDVFLPYIYYDTVFDNARVCQALGQTPVPFTDYAGPLYAFAKQHHFHYPYAPYPAGLAEAA